MYWLFGITIGLAELGSQLTSVLNRNKVQVSRISEAQIKKEREEEKRSFFAVKEV